MNASEAGTHSLDGLFFVPPPRVIDAAGRDRIEIDEASLLEGGYSRHGADLVIAAPDGRQTIIAGYFSAPEPAGLASPDGAMLLAHTVGLLAGPASPGQYAQAAATGAGNPIGNVASIQGGATVQHADGTSEELAGGSPIFEDDVIATGDGAKLSLKFIDGTALTMSANARMVMDELVYDPAATDNSMVLNLVQGSFVFVTGLVAKTGTVRADTPVATMGIRGTTPVVTVESTSATRFGIAPDPDGTVGSYQIINLVTGQVIGTVSSTEFIYRLASVDGLLEQFQVDPTIADEINQLLQDTYNAIGPGGGQNNNPDDNQDGGNQGGQNDDPNLGGDETDFANLEIEELGGDTGAGETEPLVIVNYDAITPPTGTDQGNTSSDPVNQPNPFAFSGPGLNLVEDGQATITGFNISYPEPLTVTITAGSTVTLNSTANLTSVSGNGTSNVTLTGPASAINNALNGATYFPTPDAEGGSLEFFFANAQTNEILAFVNVPVSITPVNDPPVAGNDSLTVTEDEPATTGNVLANDTDVDNTLTAASITAFTQAANGTVVNNGDGTFTYTPDANYNGPDSFTYTISDGEFSSTATVNVNVTPVNDPAIITFNGVQDTSVVEAGGIANGTAGDPSASGDLNIADVDAGQAQFQVPASLAGTYGDFTFNAATGAWTYTLDNDRAATQALDAGDNVTDTLTVASLDGTDSETITVNIAGANDAPVIAGGDTAGTVQEDTTNSVSGQLTASDPDADAQLAWSLSGADFAFNLDTLTITRNGNVIFDDTFDDGVAPPDGPNGAASYILPAGMAIPEGGGDAILSGAYGHSSTAPGSGDPFTVVNAVVRTDIDPNNLQSGLKIGDDFTVEGVFDLTLPDDNREAFGIRLRDRLIDGDGTVPDQPGDDVIELIVVKGPDGVLRVQLREKDFVADTVTPIDTVPLDAPEGADQILLRLDHDAGEPGTVVASFDFLSGGEVVATYTFQASAQIFGTETPNDFSDDEGWTRAEIIAWSPEVAGTTLTGAYGTLSIDQNGNWTYNLDNDSAQVQALGAGESVVDSFEVAVTDEHGARTTETVNITVNGKNDAPVAVQDHVVTDEETVLTGNLFADNQLGADSDIDGDELTVVSITVNKDTVAEATYAVGQEVTLPSGAKVTVQSDGTFVFDPRGAFDFVPENGGSADSFHYTISDGQGGTSTALAVMSVTGINDAPVLASEIFVTDVSEDASAGIVVPAYFALNNRAVDADNDDNATTLTYSFSNIPQVGTFQITQAGLTFTPGDDFQYLKTGEHEDVTVTVTATDSHNATSNESTLTFRVVGADDAPVANDDTVIGIPEDAGRGGVPAYTANLFADNGNGADYDPDAGDTLTVTRFRVDDNDDNVIDDNDTWVTINAEGGGTHFNDSAANPDAGYVTVYADGTIEIAPGTEFDYLAAGEDALIGSLEYEVSDGTATATAIATGHVTGANDAPVAIGGKIITNAHTSVSGQLAGFDAEDGGNLAFSLITPPDTGTLNLSLDGSFTFTPGEEETATGSFTFAVTDSNGAVAQATYGIEVLEVSDPNPANAVSNQTGTAANGQDVTVILTTESKTVDDTTFADVAINLADPTIESINISFVFDASGSMGSEGYALQMQAIQNTINDLRTQFEGTSAQVEVQMVRYSSSVTKTDVYDLYNGTLDNVIGEFPFTGGGTNFELALQAVQSFLGSPGQAGDTNYVIFTSDGDGSGSFQDEATAIKALADVSAFGIGAGASLDSLHIIDSDGSARRVDSADDLTAAFSVTPIFGLDLISFQLTLAIDGGDPVVVADEADLVQNGINYTLSLEAIQGLSAQLGANNVLTAAVTFDSDGNPENGEGESTFTVSNTIAGTAMPLEINGTEGNDFLIAGFQDDTLYGGAGNDVLIGGAGSDNLTGGAGSDLFVLDSFDGIDNILDFNLDEDTLNIAALLEAAFNQNDPGEFVTALAQLNQANEITGVDVYVDADGNGEGADPVHVASLLFDEPASEAVLNVVFDQAGNSADVTATVLV